MRTSEFLELLGKYPEKSLILEYRPGKTIGANYHITEVKNVTVDSVDCGAGTDFWKETVIQIWESPAEKNKRDYMTVAKAVAILDRVDGIKPMDRDAVVRIEYGNGNFHTTQLFITEMIPHGHELRIALTTDKTQCKALETCGILPGPPSSEREGACCTADSGCC